MDSNVPGQDAAEMDEFQDAMDEGVIDGHLNEDGTFDYKDTEDNEYRLPKHWDFDNAFKYESDDLKQIFKDANPGNTATTEEMKKFVPTEIIMKFGFYPQRLMFYVENHDLDEFELQKLQEFKQYCKKKGLRMPSADPEILRYLQHNTFQVEPTYHKMQARIQTMDERLPVNVTNRVFDLINNGVLYIAGRDRNYRPIIVFQPRIIFEMKPEPTPEELIAAAFLNIFFNNKYMLHPGAIENFILLVDMRGQNIFNIPYSLMRDAFGFITQVIKGRSRSVYILNAPTTFSFLWSTCKYFLDANTVRKVQIVSGNSCRALLEMVHPAQLEEKYGGKAKDRASGQFWPPSCPSDDFGIGVVEQLDNMSYNEDMLINEAEKEENSPVPDMNEGQIQEKYIQMQQEHNNN